MTSFASKLKSRQGIFSILAFLLGALIVLVPFLSVYLHNKSNKACDDTPATWNGSDYQSNRDYYKNFAEHSLPFNQLHNLRLDRLSSPRFHPTDGSGVLYLRKQYHLPDLNGSATTLHWAPSKFSSADQIVQLTRPIWGVQDQQFFWIDAKTVLFLSNRASSGLTQIFQLNLPDNISKVTKFIDPIQVTDYPLSIDNLLVNRQASRLAFSCQVYANLSIEQTAARQSAEKKRGGLYYTFDKLFIRHWDEYMLGLRHHPFVANIERNAKGIFQVTSTPRDVLFGIDSDSPTRPFGDAKSQWSFSTSGNSFAFTRQHDETSAVAWTTNLDIYTVDLTKPDSSSQCITQQNQAADTDPRYSPTDENVLIYRAQAVPGYESDQFKLKMYDGANVTRTLLNTWDISIQAATWSRDGQSLFVEVGELAENRLYLVSQLAAAEQRAELVHGFGASHDVNLHPTDNSTFVFTHAHFGSPTNIFLKRLGDDTLSALTDHNDNLLRSVKIGQSYEKFSFVGAENETVFGWHVTPPSGNTTRAPLAFLIHGGPQNSWYNTWGFGWNFQVFAAQGYAVIAINFHGSDSYGQNFTDSITGHYGTLPYHDLQLGLTAALEKYSYIDGSRAVALGASFGGFMINWIAGHPEMSQRFRALVCHDGLFDMREMAYATEELWFSEHDAGGVTPFEHPEAFEKYNPINYVANWTQPMLIIHGGLDYRVPETQGIGAFTALQRRLIPSRLLYFPKENHWTLNTFNSLRWFDEVFQWMHQWTTTA